MTPAELTTVLARADALESTGNLAASADVLEGVLPLLDSTDMKAQIQVRIQAAREASEDHTRQSLPHPHLGPRLPITDLYA